MTEEQKQIVKGYNFPIYYSLLYKVWKYFLRFAILGVIIGILVLMILYNETRFDNFDLVRNIVFGVFGAGLLMLSGYLYKNWHLKKYLKKHKMSLMEWNVITHGMTIDDIKKL